jgi:hypothetical protein
MSRARRANWRLRLGRWLIIALPTRGAWISIGGRGRRLTIGRTRVTVRVGWRAVRLIWIWRRARQRLRKRRGDTP